MTGKELILVLAVAGAGGAAGGVAANVVAQPAPAPDPSVALADRLSALETAIARSTKMQEDSRSEATKLAERVSQIQVDVAAAGEAARAAKESSETAAADPGRPGRAKRPAELGAGGFRLSKSADGTGGLTIEGSEELAKLPEILRARLGDEVGKGMQGLAEGLRLRMLPEAERWEKAKTDVGLQDYQVENLKKAIADRDAAMKDSMQVETSTDGANRNITIRRADPEKMAAARKTYDESVSRILDNDQKKKWDEKGYGRAFGGPGSGVAMTIVTADAVHMGDEAEEKK